MNPTDRSVGALLGHAVGNVMGLGREGFPKRVAAERPLIPPIWEAESLPDDDLAMALVLAEHLVEYPDGIKTGALLQGYVQWMGFNGRGIGSLTRHVLQLAAQSGPNASRIIWEQRGGASGSVLGNGSVMRCTPLALRFRKVLPRACEQARLDSSLTHWDSRCCWASAGVVSLIAGHVNETTDVIDATFFLLQRLGGCMEVLNVLRSSNIGPHCPETTVFDGFDSGSCLVALRAARWAAQWATDFEQSLTRVLCAGGDTDTNGAVVGAVLGARFPDAIPKTWLSCVPAREEIIELATSLSAIAAR